MSLIPDFKDIKERNAFLVENKDTLILQKKANIKQVGFGVPYFRTNAQSSDTFKAIADNVKALNVTAIINTTNVIDSHNDVHLKGLWNKSLKEKAAKTNILTAFEVL